jgi:hypothetical protein
MIGGGAIHVSLRRLAREQQRRSGGEKERPRGCSVETALLGGCGGGGWGGGAGSCGQRSRLLVATGEDVEAACEFPKSAKGGEWRWGVERGLR